MSNTVSEKKLSPWVKNLLEFGPVVAFFVAYSKLKDTIFTIGGTEYEGFIVVTAGFVPLMLLSTFLIWKLSGKLSRMQVMTTVLVVVFGGLSVWLNDPKFLQMKPTILYVFFGGALAVGLLQGKSYLEYVMDAVLPLTHKGWMILTQRMTILFFGLAAANEVIRNLLSEETWVYFKTFGLPVIMIVFFMTQTGLFQKHTSEPEE